MLRFIVWFYSVDEYHAIEISQFEPCHKCKKNESTHDKCTHGPLGHSKNATGSEDDPGRATSRKGYHTTR